MSIKKQSNTEKSPRVVACMKQPLCYPPVLTQRYQAMIKKVAVSLLCGVRKRGIKPTTAFGGAALRLQPGIASNCKY